MAPFNACVVLLCIGVCLLHVTSPVVGEVPSHLLALSELSLRERAENVNNNNHNVQEHGYYPYAYNDTQPRQIHVSLGQAVTAMTIKWSTRAPLNESVVQLYTNTNGSPSDTWEVEGVTARFFQLDFTLDDTQFVHSVELTDLNSTTTYFYRCTSDGIHWSKTFSFTTLPLPGDPTPLQYAVYGDWGFNMSSKSLPHLTEKTEAGFFDLQLFIGDISYDLNTDSGMIGDMFLEMIEPITANSPVQMCPGNHEADSLGSFHNYRHRFRMPGYNETQNMYWSRDVGLAHIISFSSEHYYTFPEQVLDIGVREQWEWVAADLEKANANRDQVPWIIMMAHRPFYCSNNDSPSDCYKDPVMMREGIPVVPDVGLPRVYGMEQLLWKYGVDLYVCGHEHSYERLWPVANNGQVYNGSYAEPYTNPGAPVHIVTGSAGNRELLDGFGAAGLGPWSAFRNESFGFGQMKIYNSSHLFWEQILDDDASSVLDEFWLIKDTHGPYGEASEENETEEDSTRMNIVA